VTPVGGFLGDVHQLATLSVNGIGHLYYVAMLLQMYVLCPLFVWFLRKTASVHLLLVIASIAAQVWLMGRVSQSPATNRELWNYQVYLVVGGVVGARFETVARRIWQFRRPLVVLILGVAVATEVQYFHAVHRGVSPTVASDPFQSRFIAFNLAGALGLYLLGAWWVSKRRPRLLEGAVKSGADNSYGVYLSHGVFLNALIFWAYGTHLDNDLHVLVPLTAVAMVWSSAAIVCSVLARTPLAWTVGRARRPARGAASLGRGEPRRRARTSSLHLSVS
jgi:probable poly-beta-1,6-N-acetyl-D-glucosamine export protein